MNSFIRQTYYQIRPLIPRRLQLAMRRVFVSIILKKCRDIWPINEKAGEKPKGWSGWPGGKKFSLVLTHDVESLKGQDLCRDLVLLEKDFGVRSSFNFVPKRYNVDPGLRHYLQCEGFEVGVHGLYHDGKYFKDRETFSLRAREINRYVKEWEAAGYRSPAMHHNLEWMLDLAIRYDSSTFDTDPFEPQPDGTETIFPFWYGEPSGERGFVEMPYTLPQDFTLFIVMREQSTEIWKRKLDWIARMGGMALLNVHPDYMCFRGRQGAEEYPASFYRDFLRYVIDRYEGEYWHDLPKNIAECCRENQKIGEIAEDDTPAHSNYGEIAD